MISKLELTKTGVHYFQPWYSGHTVYDGWKVEL